MLHRLLIQRYIKCLNTLTFPLSVKFFGAQLNSVISFIQLSHDIMHKFSQGIIKNLNELGLFLRFAQVKQNLNSFSVFKDTFFAVRIVIALYKDIPRVHQNFKSITTIIKNHPEAQRLIEFYSI